MLIRLARRRDPPVLAAFNAAMALWIQSVYVHPDHRRRGIYRRLYRFVQALAAKRRSVCGFRLYVDRDNARARRVYRALGMEQTPTRFFTPMRARRRKPSS
ncbi:MAG: GNAT family N-acetyltransferase [Betaproteobacteria bacterium]